MTRIRATLLSSGLCFGLAAAALAMPPVMDRVPDNALFVGLIPSPDNLHKDLSALSTAVDFPFPIQDIQSVLAMGGITNGVDTTKAFALVVLTPPKDDAKDAKQFSDTMQNADKLAVFLLPITKYADFIKPFEITPAGPGKTDKVMIGGDTVYVKDLGDGYAVLSAVQANVDAFTGKSGADSIKSKMGKSGETLADASDVAFVVNMDPLRTYMPEIIAEMKEKAKEQSKMMGQNATSVDAQLQVATWLVESVANDARAVISGAKFGTMGVAMDLAANFKDGSYFAKAFATGGKPNALLNRLPMQDYLVAAAVDTGVAGFHQFVVDLANKSAASTMSPEAAKASTAVVTNSEGYAVAVGFPKGGALAGLLTSTIQFNKSKDPAAAIADFRKNNAAMDGQNMNGVTLKSSYIEKGAKVNDKDVDVWSFKLTTEGQANQMAAQGMQLMFGTPDGPVGYVAPTTDGVYCTYSKNSELLGKALSLGADGGLGSDKLAAQVAEQFPKNRLAEVYIGTKSLLEMVTPFVAMIGVPVPMDKVPEQLPPIGMALAGDNGAARFNLTVPAPIIKTGIMLGNSVSEQMNGGGAPEPANGDHKGGKATGQPKF